MHGIADMQRVKETFISLQILMPLFYSFIVRSYSR